MKKVLAAGFFAAGLMVAAALVWWECERFLDSPLSIPAEGVVVQIPRGMAFMDMVSALQGMGVTARRWPWRLAHMLEGRTIRAGEYFIETGTTPREWLGMLAQGRVMRHRFTIIEGWTFRQLRQALSAEPRLVQSLDGASDGRVMALLDQEEKHPEGRFLPETYQFVRGDSDLDLLRRAMAAMDTALEEAWQSRKTALPLATPYELLILASIIEKETAVAEERSRIAGVFVRRLEKGMRLQTDPTVIYGLGQAFDGNLRVRDLNQDTPYNTYTRKGLPPSPIAMPGKASLSAAANPEKGESLYFVATGDGRHYFSATLEEHNKAVDRYQRKR